MILAKLLYNHFSMINSRLKTFSGIIKSLILCRGTNYKNLAEEIAGDILLDSKIKRVSRFLAGDNIDTDCYYEFIRDCFPKGKALLSIDRTHSLLKYGMIALKQAHSRSQHMFYSLIADSLLYDVFIPT